MSARSSRTRGGSSPSVPGQPLLQLPFTNDATDQDDFVHKAPSILSADRTGSRFLRSQSSSSGLHLSSSYSHKTPARSFFHHASQANLGESLSVETAELVLQEPANGCLRDRRSILVTRRPRTNEGTGFMGHRKRCRIHPRRPPSIPRTGFIRSRLLLPTTCEFHLCGGRTGRVASIR